ncbi:hypothetical protein KCMC57_up57180 [Kitasatospora sp. CMC57]|uniref:Aspartate/glutamate/uridylate kinase domain-containing protein n=1 Tax=Kitasatospora sp. CMC57 TaxID=3231513 RepID=A0AB33K3J5_9ACTN
MGEPAETWHERIAQLLPDGPAHRRVVPSPPPLAFLETRAIGEPLRGGAVVICAGGGGVPVVRHADTGRVRGVEAVVDKDLAAVLLAEQLGADALLILTDVTHFFTDFGAAHPAPLVWAAPGQLRALDLSEGSMRPKARAAAACAERTGGLAAIGPLDDALGTLSGTTGTTVVTTPRAGRPGPLAPQPGPSALGAQAARTTV